MHIGLFLLSQNSVSNTCIEQQTAKLRPNKSTNRLPQKAFSKLKYYPLQTYKEQIT